MRKCILFNIVVLHKRKDSNAQKLSPVLLEDRHWTNKQAYISWIHWGPESDLTTNVCRSSLHA